ncbi:hypothetical protein BDA99DRAFT_495744 [Phascolomyces articulosus]|uniref:Chromatin modification-related protein n=1 Tax=Phascolomyces articulosus TaxID=60185 RepID=A0AAD5KLD8_9FUNG|nr:hypothetical protein BDA99DRAFT_495744 [Phascolomyces articulosus]
MENDIQDDSGRYLQEYVQSLENLPSEIKYHWAEVLNRNEAAQKLERRIHSHQHDLSKFHKQWFQAEMEKKKKIQKHEPILINSIQRDYDKLEDLATERIQLMEGALQLVDRHLHRLGTDLDAIDGPRPPQTPTSSSYPTTTTTPATRIYKRPIYQEQEDVEELDEEELQNETIKHQQQQRRKRKERDETNNANGNNEGEPLYCYCRQVSFGEMVGCDGEHCPYEWFHMECVGLTAPPKGSWYCDECLAENQKHRQTTPTRKGSSSGQSHKKLKRKKDPTPS